ncbi:MAG: hypothetical protein JWO45_1033 [Spartobacteria bacterium]|nr:hypothetical protein [Spartobacteria bacterium]
MCFRLCIEGYLTFQFEVLDWLLRARTQFIVVWALVHDACVGVSDIRHVCSLIDNSDVALGRNDCLFSPSRPKLSGWHETILRRPDVVVTVGPVANTGAPIEARFGRKRRPTYVIITFAPRNPGRRPFVAGHPNPSNILQTCPASIMIGRPTKSLVRYPGPAGVGIDPVAVCVRAPISGVLRFARLPDVTVIRSFQPRPLRFQSSVKNVVGRRRPAFFDRNGAALRAGNMSGRRALRCGALVSGKSIFARLKFCFSLRELLLLLSLAFSIEPLLHLALDLRFSFLFGDLLLARRTN